MNAGEQLTRTSQELIDQLWDLEDQGATAIYFDAARLRATSSEGST